MADDTHEGRKIKKLLDDSGHTIADLKVAANCSWPGAKKWIESEELGEKARISAAQGLLNLGLDARAVWPWLSNAQIGSDLDALKAVVNNIPVEHLQSVRQLLSAKTSDQVRLVDYIDGIIDLQARRHR